jgi:hypothetical protein
MPRPQTLLFALKLLAAAEDAQELLTQEEVLEAFMNITGAIKDGVEQKLMAQALAEKVAAATKRNPNLVN